MTVNISKTHLKFYQKLISKLDKIKNKDNNFVYFSNRHKLCFLKTENKDKYIYYFGLNNKRLITIDIDKYYEYSNKCLGLLLERDNNIIFALNLNILKERYPDIDVSSYKIHNGIYRSYIELGDISSKNFIKRLESFLGKIKTPEDFSNKTEGSETMDKCEICKKSKNKNMHPFVKKISTRKGGYCGDCIEKILACEFLKKANNLLQNNETKTLKISREKYSNEDEFDFGIKLLEKYDILKYVGVKKLFFTVDRNNPIIKEYNKYIDENNYLLDNIFSKSGETEKQKEKKINLFINALSAGKSHSQAYRISKLSKHDVDNFYNLGKKGDKNYLRFYQDYNKFRVPKIEMNEFIKAIKKEDNIEKALNRTNLDMKTVKKWYELGKNGNDDYSSFYKQCNLLLSGGFEQKSDDELIRDFINLKNSGKTNRQAIDELKISNTKIKQWVNKGNLGNEDYKDFYDAYTSKKEKSSCKYCGRKINSNNTRRICKRCDKKRFAGNIVLKLLKHFSSEETFKKEDLKVLNLNDMQITEYLWTLNEFNLVTEKNNRYQLKSIKEIEDFLKSCGLEIGEISNIESKKNLYKTCKKCNKSLLIKSHFKNGDDICKNCKKQMNTAKYLTELMQYVDFDKEFSEDDLKQYYDDSFKLQAKLWSLADNDLVKKDLKNNTYVLSDTKTVNGFLEKYGEGSIESSKTDDVQLKPQEDDAQQKTQENDVQLKPQEDDGILTLIPEDLEKELKRRSKGNKTGFAWVNKIGKTYKYSQTINRKRIEIKDKNIHKLYEKVKNEGLIWGVRNLTLARQTLGLDQKESEDMGMYEPIPEKYLKTFRTKGQTGIAWVNIVGNAFVYSRSVNSIPQYYRDEDIKKLYEKVKADNQVWGIRDYKKASKYIDFPEDFKIPKTPEQSKAAESKPEKSEIKTPKPKPAKNTIYSLLDDKFLTDEVIKNSPTGIAWVSEKNGRFIYNRQNDNQIMRLSDSSINNLYKKVIDNKGIWGITDEAKADKILNPESLKPKTKSKSKTKTKLNVTCFEKTKSKMEVIIKGRIKNNQLINVLNDLKTFELNIERIITNTLSYNVDLFVEMEIPKRTMDYFERYVNELGWNINK